MTKIFNGTPHAINVVENSVFNPSIRKYTGGSIVLSITSNVMLNAKISSITLPSIVLADDLFTEEYDDCGNIVLNKHYAEIPVVGKSFTGIDPLPEGYDIYIVSALYSSAAIKAGMDMSKIYTVSDPVYTDDGNSFLGCRGICPAF